MAYDTRDLPPARTDAQRRADEHYAQVELAFKSLSPERPLAVQKDALLTILTLFGGDDLIAGCRKRFNEMRAADIAAREKEAESSRLYAERLRQQRADEEARQQEHQRRMREDRKYAWAYTQEQERLNRRW